MDIKLYLDKIYREYKTGRALELSYRGFLKDYIEALDSNIFAINEPEKTTSVGKPDYLIQKRNVEIGYIEAKDIHVDLNKTETSEQMERYLGLNNLVLTNYLEFRFYRNREKIQTIKLADITNNNLVPYEDEFEKFENAIQNFITFIGVTIKSSKKLAQRMALKARGIKHKIEEALSQDFDNDTLSLQLKVFRDVLMHDLSETEFADMYAQTVTYGLFIARLHDKTLEDFSRREAIELIPRTNPFLRKFFDYISGVDLDERIAWMIDDLAEMYRYIDVKELLKDFGKSTGRNDPFIHFYEDFLTEYDKNIKNMRGAYYTPEPVVNFIVRAVDDILQTEFGLVRGLADTSKVTTKKTTGIIDTKTGEMEKEDVEVDRVQILDPATGTGTFLAETIKYVYTKFKGQEGMWDEFVNKNLIPRLYGFEISMAPYTMAHLKLELLLRETMQEKNINQRLNVFLTNSLEEAEEEREPLGFSKWLSDESNEANRIKRETPVMCVIGNPPYLGESKNKGDWIMGLMNDYKKEPGGKEKLKERNPKWLNDDYVKFIRYAQYFIEKNESGILGFINPHGFLDNPTFRGMRWNLLKTYDKIYTIDLHGNAKKKEVAPDGGKDENVFDIMQGVSINVFIKTGNKKPNELGKLFHYDLYGRREDKYDFLSTNTLASIEFKEIPNQAPMYFMAQKNFDVEQKYRLGFVISELFKLNSVGVVTARDNFTIHYKKEEVKKTVETFLSLEYETARTQFNLGKDVRDWQVGYAKKDLEFSYPNKGSFVKISYRPFDDRWTFFTGQSRGFHCYPRTDVMQHFLKGENVGLTICKQFKTGNTFQHVFISNLIIESSFVSNKTSEITSTFPLYLYPDENGLEQTRTPNLNQEIVQEISDKVGLPFVPEKEPSTDSFAPIDLLDYIYAVLHSLAYRETYKEFLKIDFPRIPYPTDKETFWKLVEIGSQIRTIHLLESSAVDNYITGFPASGNNNVIKKHVKYKETNKTKGQVWINDAQYFDNVPAIAWNFYIGGYQPAQKWLKDRNGRTLTIEDIQHYQKIIVALVETDRLMKKVDTVLEM